MQASDVCGAPSAACVLEDSCWAASGWQVRQEAEAVFAVWPGLAAPAWQSRQPRSLCTLARRLSGLSVMFWPLEFTRPVEVAWQERQSSAAWAAAMAQITIAAVTKLL